MYLSLFYLLLQTYTSAHFSQDVMKVGETQYQLLQERSNLPQYGTCWKQALQDVHQGCNALSEDIQGDIALKLTNCFLEMSGDETYHHCESDKKQNLRKICISGMSDRAFNVYTQFYTHTQNICWFLRGQIWQEILVERTYQVGKQLKASAENQEKLLDVQKESLMVQERSLKYGQDLKEIIEAVRNRIANSHETVLDIQNWLISEMSWFDTILFYIMSLSFVFIFTSLRSSTDCRLPLLLLLFSGLLLERFICQLFLEFYRDEKVDSSHEVLMRLIWFFRYTLAAVCVLIIIISICSYKDYEKINNRLLIEIHLQNDKLMKLLKNKGTSKNESFNVDILLENEVQKLSDKILVDNKIQNKNNVVKREVECDHEKNSGIIHSPVKNSRKLIYKPPNVGNLKKYNLRDRQGTPDIR